MEDSRRRDFMISTAVVTMGLSVGAQSTVADTVQKSSLTPIVHHVFFWLKRPSSSEDRARLIAGLQTLKNIETVRGIHIGIPAQTERRDVVDASYSVSEILLFDDLAGQKAYQDHPIHKQFVADCEHLWQRVVVYDIESVG